MPEPKGVVPVSPVVTTTSLGWMPKLWATAWATVVSCPCPPGASPSNTSTLPRGSSLHGRSTVARLVLHRHEQLGGDARELHAEAEADAEIAALGPRRRLTRAEAGEIGLRHKVVPDLDEVAAVEILVGDRGVGERGDQVLAAHVRRLHAAALRHHVDGTLHGEAGRQLAESAGRRERGLVGDGDLHLDVADRPVVGVGQLDRAEEGHQEAPVDPLAAIAAVGEAAIADRKQLAVARRRDLEIVNLVALLAHRHQVLLARLDPADRPAQILRHVGDQNGFTVEGAP